MKIFILALFTAASLLAMDGVSRQIAAVERQKRATSGPGGSLQRQQMAVAKQRTAAEATRHDEPWDLSPSNFDRSSEAAIAPACSSLDWGLVRDRFEEEEKRDELPAGLLGAVARQESGLYPCAVSSAGATGLMQLMPATAAQFGVDDRFDPWQSLQGGGQFLRQLLYRYKGDLSMALGAYNAGPSRVDAFAGVPPFAETRNYIESVMSRMKPVTAAGNPEKP